MSSAKDHFHLRTFADSATRYQIKFRLISFAFPDCQFAWNRREATEKRGHRKIIKPEKEREQYT